LRTIALALFEGTDLDLGIVVLNLNLFLFYLNVRVGIELLYLACGDDEA